MGLSLCASGVYWDGLVSQTRESPTSLIENESASEVVTLSAEE